MLSVKFIRLHKTSLFVQIYGVLFRIMQDFMQNLSQLYVNALQKVDFNNVILD